VTGLAGGIGHIRVGGVDRAFDLALPPPATINHPAPLILLFHGFLGTGASMEQLTGMLTKGAAMGSYVAAPDGAAKNWQINAHGTDAVFVDTLVGRLTSLACIDLDRVYATGFSAGAAFTILYGCARQDRVAAIATVAVDFQLGCTTPMPILAFHGTKDGAVPFDNGAIGVSLPGVKVRGTELNMADWARLDGCRPTPLDEKIGSEVTKQTWANCAPGSDVVLYRIEGGGHSWPGANPSSGFGLTTEQIAATDEILAFFAAHSHH
jgi:polyhydroxybutyrate depolymerase